LTNLLIYGIIEVMSGEVVVHDDVVGKFVVPIDRSRLERLAKAFSRLSTLKQNFLLTRFPSCETDRDAMSRMKESEWEVVESQLANWKKNDMDFRTAYDLMKEGIVDLAAHLARTIEQGNAVLAAMENRKLIMLPWDKVSARAATAKSAACNQALDRIVGKKETVKVATVHIDELLDD